MVIEWNGMEWDILMAIMEDMTSNTLQQRMIPQKTQTKTLVKILYNWKSSGTVSVSYTPLVPRNR